jgi:hypothetical protein
MRVKGDEWIELLKIGGATLSNNLVRRLSGEHLRHDVRTLANKPVTLSLRVAIPSLMTDTIPILERVAHGISSIAQTPQAVHQTKPSPSIAISRGSGATLPDVGLPVPASLGGRAAGSFIHLRAEVDARLQTQLQLRSPLHRQYQRRSTIEPVRQP